MIPLRKWVQIITVFGITFTLDFDEKIISVGDARNDLPAIREDLEVKLIIDSICPEVFINCGIIVFAASDDAVSDTDQSFVEVLSDE